MTTRAAKVRWWRTRERPLIASVHLLALLVCTGAVSGTRAAAVQPLAARALPGVGAELEAQQLATGASHAWSIELGSNEYVDVRIELLAPAETDESPAVTVDAPGGRTIFESVDPHVVSGIDGYARMAVSFVTERPGLHRLHIAARVSPARYRLQLAEHRPTVEADRRRLAAHTLWREGMRAFVVGSPESLRTSLAPYEQALAILAEIEDREGEAETLATLSAAHYVLSDAKRGTVAATRALEIWTGLEREREIGVAMSDLGLLAYLAYDRTAARTYYDQALVKHRSTGDGLAEARTLTRIGWLHYGAAELPAVIENSQRARELFRAASDPVGESIAFNDLGRAYLDLGDVAQSLDAYQRALALRPPDRYPRGAANVLVRTGLVYLAVSEWQRALDDLQRALALARRARDTRTEISALVNLGSAYITLGDAREGSRYLEPALTHARGISFRGAEAYALLWLGLGASLEGDQVRGRDYLQQAVDIQASIKDVRGQASALRQLAALQLAMGGPHEALGSITKSIEVSPPANGLIFSGALTLANAYAALGDADKAQAQYEEALRRFREIRARNMEALTLTRYGRSEGARGRYAEARGLLHQALVIHESLRGLIVDPDLRMSYGTLSIGPYEEYIDVLMAMERQTPGEGLAADAFHVHERARARGLLELLGTAGVDIHEGVDSTLVERERTLRWSLNRKAAIQTSLLTGAGDKRRLAGLEREIADLSRSWRETRTLIQRQSPAYASLTEPEPLTAVEVSKLLDPHTVLLSFAPGARNSWLFAVTESGVESFDLGARAVIDDAARAVHRLLTARQPRRHESSAEREARLRREDAELSDRSRALSALVLGPIADRLADSWRGRRLAIVASGALEYVPFAMLPLPTRAPQARSRALIAAHEIVTLPSASTLALLRRESVDRPVASKLIAVIADPVFGADDPRVKRASAGDRVVAPAGAVARGAANEAAPDTRSIETRALESLSPDGTRAALARLPFSRAEALAVASQVPRPVLLQATDFDATLGLATSGRLNDYRIVHFATHGVINTTRPELSGLALSLVDEEGRTRDGFLRLNTIYNLRLSADLVVLSACQTALGKEVAGEGLVGLTRGFMYAGARRVIASLWQVSDVATAELMKKFYAGLLQRRLSASSALRHAQLEMSRDPRWSAPYYWAGFVLQGDWRQ
jgi:CHAT domain-containing protein/tetratricopeptide (TPR) repeat protein